MSKFNIDSNHAPRILILGAAGRLGRLCADSFGSIGAVSSAPPGIGWNIAALTDLVNDLKPDVIVNTVAYTAVDRAEIDCAAAAQLNTELPLQLALLARQHAAWLIHFSTDYVFDGINSHLHDWRESDPATPQSVYGETKLYGDQAIEQYADRYLIFRIGWLYAHQGHDFLSAILQSGLQQSSLSAPADQIGTPTSAEFVAAIVARCLKQAMQDRGLKGLYHLAPQGRVSRADYARHILAQARNAGFQTANVISTPAAQHPLHGIARRPLLSSLDTTHLMRRFSLPTLPAWQSQVDMAIHARLKAAHPIKNV